MSKIVLVRPSGDTWEINLSRYGGYLSPWAQQIVELYAAGITQAEIAQRLRPCVLAEYKGAYWNYAPTAAMISYVLQRVGVPPGHAGRPPGPNQLSVIPLPGGWRQPTEREKRWERITDEWLAENVRRRKQAQIDREYEEREAFRLLHMSGGRPIDMGGPRDVWIEKSPWDER